MPALRWEGGKGINKDQAPSELAPGVWSDCQNMRFRNGRDERVGGIASVLTPSITPYGMFPYSSGNTRLLVYCGTTKAYKHDGTTETEITRTTNATPQTISAISRTSNVVTVTTAAAHGLATGNKLNVNVKSPTNMSGTNVTITVGSTTTFTYANTGANATGDAARTNYTILDSGSSAVNFTGGVDDKWTGGNFNGVIVVNSPVDGLFYYDAADTGKLHAFAGTTYKSDVARPFRFYIFQLAPTINSVKQRHGCYWSAAAVPGAVPTEFVASSTNDAGGVDLVSDGEMVDACVWGDSLIVYKRDVRFRVSYIGGNAVWDFHMVSGNSKDDGALAANCIANTPVGQVYLTTGKDIKIHSGGEGKSIAEGRVREWLRANIDTTYQARSFVSVNEVKKEVWVCFPMSGQSTVSKALIWNWEADAWGLRDLSGVTCGCDGLLPTSIANSSRLLLATSTPRIGLVDSGSTDFGATITSTLERTGIDAGTPNWKTLYASFPRFDASTAFTASVYHGSAPTPDGTVTYAGPQTYTHNTTKRVTGDSYSGPYLALKITTTAADQPTLRSIDLEFTQDGTD